MVYGYYIETVVILRPPLYFELITNWFNILKNSKSTDIYFICSIGDNSNINFVMLEFTDPYNSQRMVGSWLQVLGISRIYLPFIGGLRSCLDSVSRSVFPINYSQNNKSTTLI